MTRPSLWNRFLAALLLLALVSCGGSARALDRDKLRQAVPLPQMNMSFGFSFGNGPDAPPDDAAARAQIATLEAAPASAEGLLRLGRLYSQVKDYDRAKATYARAVPLWREALAARPDDVALWVQLGAALRGAAQADEAEAILRRSAQIAPQNVSAWTGLGDVLLAQVNLILIPSQVEFHTNLGATPTFEGLSAAQLDARPTPDAIARAQALLDEAGASYERAVQAAPRDPAAIAARMKFRSAGALLRGLLQGLRANETATLKEALSKSASNTMAVILSPENVADLQTSARLRPDDISAQGAAAFATVAAFLTRNERGFPLKGGLESLPAPVAAPVREVMERLESLAQGGGKNEATALEALGIMRFVLGDPLAIDTLRRAVALDPTLGQGWEILAGMLVSDNRFYELATLIQSRLQRQDTARNHLLLAKVYDKMNRPQDVETQVRAALEREPDDLTANLARIALLLRAGDTAQAEEPLARTAKRLAPAAKPSRQQTLDYGLLRGIFLALSDESAAARQQLQTVLTSDPKNQAAQKALAALNP